MTAIDVARGSKPIQVEFEVDSTTSWAAVSSVKRHPDAEAASIPAGLGVGCAVEAQDPHDTVDKARWHKGRVEGVKQTGSNAASSGLLFWIKFVGSGTNQWCRLQHVRPVMLSMDDDAHISLEDEARHLDEQLRAASK